MKKRFSDFFSLVGMTAKLVWPYMRTVLGPFARNVWKKGGYYISLVALLLVVGAASYTIRERPSAQGGPTVAPTPAPTPVAAPVILPVEPEFQLMAPVQGEIAGEYVVDRLIWSETLGQWQTHAGVDIAAPLGTAVYASEAGTVKSAYRDALWGNTVVISHPEGYETVYACLNTLSLVEPGAEVERGEILSAVGNSGSAEESLGAHLHFEVWKDGEPVPPMENVT